ncbi:VWA domain-containing protein [Seonamhaeicola sp. NFXS20]|uniref:hypothetical protein n=1 Tax=Seonamhaeicola sp. NFXS20 TaxID=2816959 RepID=UPI003B8E7A31
MSNSKQWSSATPGYIIFLVDQSGSMQENYPEQGDKASFASLVINRTINSLILANMDGETVKDRVFISIIGYGGSRALAVDDIRSEYLSTFADKPLKLEKIKKKVSDGGGGLVEIEEELPIFIEPVANGLTPMADALSFAKELIQGWLQKKPDNPAPIIINISDGLPYTGDTVESEIKKSITIANDIMSITSDDGNPLVYNAHIGDSGTEHKFPSTKTELADEQAKFLYEISSSVPDSHNLSAKKKGIEIKDNAKGFVSNARPEAFIEFIEFGSMSGMDATGN